AWRTVFYRHLAPIANRWQESLGADYRYPDRLEAFLQRNREAGQAQPLSRLDRLVQGDYLALHQCTDGAHVFPLQLVLLLSEPGEAFTGGEFVMTEQRPRMQSRPMVVPLGIGDAAVIATAGRPVRGGRTCYRVNLRHAISRVHHGERIGVELSFHDSPSDTAACCHALWAASGAVRPTLQVLPDPLDAFPGILAPALELLRHVFHRERVG